MYTCCKEGLIPTAGEDKTEVRGVVGVHGVQRWQTERQHRAQHAATRASRRGAASESQLGGILAHAHPGTLSWPHPAWNLLFSRILPDPLPPLPASTSPLHSAHQQTPNKHASRKQTPAQPARSPPPPSSQEAKRRHFTRTDDAAKTTIMIINLLNLEDYAVN